jgi:hypothetical protein
MAYNHIEQCMIMVIGAGLWGTKHQTCCTDRSELYYWSQAELAHQLPLFGSSYFNILKKKGRVAEEEELLLVASTPILASIV